MPNLSNAWMKLLALPLAVCCVLALPAISQAQTAPHFKFDPDWPKLPLPKQVVDDGRHGIGRR